MNRTMSSNFSWLYEMKKVLVNSSCVCVLHGNLSDLVIQVVIS